MKLQMLAGEANRAGYGEIWANPKAFWFHVQSSHWYQNTHSKGGYRWMLRHQPLLHESKQCAGMWDGCFLCLSVRPGPPVPGGDSTNSNHRSHVFSGLRPNFCWKHLLVSHNLNRTGSHMGVTLDSAFRRARTHLQTNTQLMLLE